MSERTFLASSYWSGALNVGEMRTFPTPELALDYVKHMPYHRVYELFDNQPPILIYMAPSRSKKCQS
jgi:hypothetical protein